MSENGTTTSARILVVEDDRSVRDVLRLALSAGGFDVAVAERTPSTA